MKNFFKKLKRITAYTWALIALVVIYFATGISTLGTTQTTGDSFYLEANKTAYFSVSRASGEKLDDIYANIGSIYATEGSSANVTLKYYKGTSNSPATSSSSWTTLGTLRIGNVYCGATKNGVDGENYNWARLIADANKSYSYISITSDTSMDINELVCLNQKGEKMTIKAYLPDGVKYKQADMLRVCDAQDSFVLNGNFKYNFTQEEAHYLTSVLTVKSGSSVLNNASYNIDHHYNFLGTVLFVPSIAMFGVNTFALRLPVFLASCALLVFAALLIRELTKNNKLSFAFATVLALGGVLTTVGKVASPFMFVASALVASLYFMYRFYARGISSKKVMKGGMNVLVSGLFAAFAMAIDATAGLPVIGILVLFVFGLRRQKAAYALELKKTEGMEETVTLKNGEMKVINKEEKRVRVAYLAKSRISIGFAALSFVAATLFLGLFAAVCCHHGYVKARNASDVGFLMIFFKQTVGSLHGYVLTANSAANASNVLAWWLPLKPATLSGGMAGGKYLAFSVLPNMVAVLAAFASFVFVAYKVIKGLVNKDADKETLRLRRGAIVLFSGMVCAMITATVRGGVTAETSLIFHVCYLGVIALAATQIPKGKIGNIALWATVSLVVVNFLLCLPALYGFAVPTGWAKAFGWTAWVNNGFFR